MKYLLIHPAFFFLFFFSFFAASVLFSQEEGIASYYGPGFDGKKTASGEIYDQEALTAAHKTLSFGSEVEVTNMANGKTVVVKVNDRGPFVPGRIIDLSMAAARTIGLTPNQGVARVSLKILSGTVTLPPVEGVFYLQIGAYRTEGNAQQTAARLETWGYVPKIKLGDFFRVYLGPLTEEQSEKADKDLRLRGFQPQKRSSPPPGYE